MNKNLKKEIEEWIAQQFLPLYNARQKTEFEIEDMGESPDVNCRDIKTGAFLGVEITLHGNLEGDIEKDFRRLRGENVTFGDTQGQAGNIENVLKNLEIALDKKRLSSYEGLDVALAIHRIYSIWTCAELIQFAGDQLTEIAEGLHVNFPKGVWFFCRSSITDNLTIIDLTEI